MTAESVTVVNQLGMHARAAAKFVHLAARYESHVRVARDSREMDGKSIMGILLLAAACGSTITIIADGRDENLGVAPGDGDRRRERHHQALLAHRKSKARNVRTAQLLDQAVVAAPAQKGVLRPQALKRDLERGAPVVVQPAHQTRVDAVADAE